MARTSLRRTGLVLALALAGALFGAPAANADQAGSKQRRAPAGFIQASYNHTCVVLNTGRVRCWGVGTHGRLGYGNTTSIGDTESPGSVGPVNLGAGRRAYALDGGFAHTCVIIQKGRVRCWGTAGSGQLGYGNVNSIGDNELPAAVGPVSIGAGRKAVGLSVGDTHTCVILNTGAVRCWGSGSLGRLGYGNTNPIGDNELPTAVGAVNLGSGSKAVAISAGTFHTCAILAAGAVRCWGNGSSGVPGLGSTATIGDNETPNSVPTVFLGAGRKAVAISAGGIHTCAILDTGRVRCWGDGASGRLGYGNVNDIGDTELPGSAGPVDLGTDRTAVAIAAGGDHTCAILDTGAVRCWGEGGLGQLGYGNTDDIGDNETPGGFGPVHLGAGRKAVAISAGDVHTCVVLDTGRVRCWGSGFNGQLGYGNVTTIGDSETPGTVGPVAAAGLVARKVRPGHSLALERKRDRSAPYTARAAGTLTGFLGDSATCSGKVRVQAKKGGLVVSKRVKLERFVGGCSYAARLVVGSGSWTVKARFLGNGSVQARASSRKRSFLAG